MAGSCVQCGLSKYLELIIQEPCIVLCIVTVLSNRWHSCDYLQPWLFVSSLQINKIAFNPVKKCLMIIKFLHFQTVLIWHHFISMMNEMRKPSWHLIQYLELCSHGPLSAQHLILDLTCWSWWWWIIHSILNVGAWHMSKRYEMSPEFHIKYLKCIKCIL